MTKEEPRDFLQELFTWGTRANSETGLPTVEHLNQVWTPESPPQVLVRFDNSGQFLMYGMALLAFRHELAPLAFRACERWANLCLEVADQVDPIPPLRAYSYLLASAWLQTGKVPEQLVVAAQPFGERCAAIPEPLEMPWLAVYSWPHALAGDWEGALRLFRKSASARPIVINTRGSMSPAQALTWAYQRLAGLDVAEKSPKQFIAALQKFLQGDGFLRETFPWLYAYQAVFAPDTHPADLLQLLRPGAS